MSRYAILSDNDIKEGLRDLLDWKAESAKLHATFTFKDFEEAMKFMNLVAKEAESLDHHPDWKNSYNKVSIALSTHAAGDKVTDFDIKLAKAISNIFKDFE